MNLVPRIDEYHTPCFVPCADCHCRHDIMIDSSEVIMTPELRAQIDAPKIAKQHEWDEFFLGMAKYVANKSKDPSTKTGAVIVRPDNSVASIGFNGFPKGMPDAHTLYEDRSEKYSRIVHCEMNAVMFARERLDGYTLYTWPFASCDRCVVHMIQAGISRYVAPTLPNDLKERWGEALIKTKKYLNECGFELSEVDFE